MVRLLLKYGADPNLRDEEGFTPRAVARKLGLVSIEKILASYGGEF
jgi:ankyrin repeat protein